MAWTVETLNETVDAELAELPADMRARLVRISELIASVGLSNVRDPHVRHVHGQLWEIRLKGKAGIARALYITVRNSESSSSEPSSRKPRRRRGARSIWRCNAPRT